MDLKVGRSYEIDGGYIIPRSHFSDDKANQFAIVEILALGDNGHYTKTHTTLTKRQIRKALQIPKNERIAII